MVFLDEVGGIIHATIKKPYSTTFLKGKFIALKMWELLTMVRTIRHSYNFNFSFIIKVRYLPNLNITRSIYHLVPIFDIVGRSYDTDYLYGDFLMLL